MKTKHLFWGFLFITLGTLILIDNFTSVNFYWINLWRYWPLFLILIGISMLIKKDAVRAAVISLTAIILAAAIFSTFKFGWDYFREGVIVDTHDGIDFRYRDDDEDYDDNDYQSKVFDEGFNKNIKYASLYFKYAAGTFNISDTTSKLFSAVTKGYHSNYDLIRHDEGDHVSLDFENTKHTFTFFKGKNKNYVNMSLNPVPSWKLSFDIGAASAKLDLRKIKVEDLDIDIGAASLEIALSNLLDSSRVDVDAGASKIEILLPDDIGCELNADIVLSKRNLEGFSKTGDKHYRTENFYSASKKIYMNIDSGVSSVTIKRYSNGKW